MKKLYYRFIAGIATTIIVYGIFFGFQVSFAQGHDQKQEARTDSINRQELLKLNNQVIQSLELKVESMGKYVDAGQKNLDLWLKLLTLLLSLAIGVSVFSGLKARELANGELEELRRIRDSINREVIFIEERLKLIREKIKQIEEDAERTKAIKDKMTETLNGIKFETDVVLNEITSKKDFALEASQKKIIDDTITKTREDLQKSGIESIKNLYYAKALKAQSDGKWEEAVRLLNLYYDFDEDNPTALSIRAHAYFKIYLTNLNKDFLNKSLSDTNEILRIDPENRWAFEMRGNVYFYLGDYEKSISDFTTCIKIDPLYARAYFNRGTTYLKMGKTVESELDLNKARGIDPEIDKKP